MLTAETADRPMSRQTPGLASAVFPLMYRLWQPPRSGAEAGVVKDCTAGRFCLMGLRL